MNIKEYLKYKQHYIKYFMGCSQKEWLARQCVKCLLCKNGYEVEEVPNPTRLNAYKDNEWFLIDIDEGRTAVMQFQKGDTTGVASQGRPYWYQTLDLLRTLGPVLTPFNMLRTENGRLVEVW